MTKLKLQAACSGLLILVATMLPGSAQAESKRTNLVAYLGVGTSPVAEALAKHLHLADGVGLVVNHVDPASPAADSLSEHDVLEKLEDQLLVSHRQLAVIIRSYGPGDEIQMSLFRQGIRTNVAVKLAAKRYFALPGERRQGIRVEPGSRFTGGLTNFPGMPKWIEERMNRDLSGGMSDFFSHGGPVTGMGIFTEMTSDHVVTLTVGPEGRTLMATDHAGKSIFQGSVDDEDEVAAIPENLTATYKRLLATSGSMGAIESIDSGEKL